MARVLSRGPTALVGEVEALEGEDLLAEALGRPALEGALVTRDLTGLADLALDGSLGAIVTVRFLKYVSKQ